MYVVRTEALDDLTEGGCPVCRAASRVERAWLRGLLDEVGDARVRSGLERGGGLCAAHVRQLVDVAVESGKTLGLGVVLEVLLSQARDDLVARRRPRRSVGGTGSLGERAGPSGCGACTSVRLREHAYTELLLAAGDAAVRERAGDPLCALCRPHLTAVRAAGAPRSRSAPLAAAASAKVDQLLAAVARSIAAHRAGSEIGPDAHEVIRWGAPAWLAGEAGRARTWAPAGPTRDRWRRGGRS